MERVFYANIVAFPKVVHENFRPKYNFIKWRNNEEEFENGVKDKLISSCRCWNERT